MKLTAVTVLMLFALMAGLFYIGGTVLIIGLAALGLVLVIFLSFSIGVKFAHKLITDGAHLAIQSASGDVRRVEALAGVTKEALKNNKPVFVDDPFFLPDGLEGVYNDDQR